MSIDPSRRLRRKKRDKKKLRIYLIGSLQNKEVIKFGNLITEATGIEVFNEWHSPGPHADDYWRDDEKAKGRTYKEAIQQSLAADHIFRFDRSHLLTSQIALLYLPAGKSAHLELGWVLGIAYLIGELEKVCKKLRLQKVFNQVLRYLPLPRRGYIILDDPERWDVMYKFAHGVFENFEQLRIQLLKDKRELL